MACGQAFTVQDVLKFVQDVLLVVDSDEAWLKCLSGLGGLNMLQKLAQPEARPSFPFPLLLMCV